MRRLELQSGISDWPLPSIENISDDRENAEEALQLKQELQDKLDVLNGCHGTFLSVRELEVCISLIDHRLGTSTSTIDVLDAFLRYPLYDPERWKRSGDIRAYMDRGSELLEEDSTVIACMRDVLILINTRAGTSFLLDELEMVVSLMNYLHCRAIGLLGVLGLGDECRPDLSSALGVVDREFVGAFGTLDIRVGKENAVQDLGDILSQARL